ncbi:hypothetical protein ACFVWR_00185 [Leifsonia sp. NPDC058292]|uniref:hypothetical protein n=1 Tax=Leifsonia sp. NPDC058292 TaxID=3346428 RepID=UPI0036DB3B46
MDGTTPMELRSAGRAELRAYQWIHIVESRVDNARPQDSTFVLSAEGQGLTTTADIAAAIAMARDDVH